MTEIKYYSVKQIKVRQGTEVWDRARLFPELKIVTPNIIVGSFSHIQKIYPTNQKLKYFSPPKCSRVALCAYTLHFDSIFPLLFCKNPFTCSLISSFPFYFNSCFVASLPYLLFLLLVCLRISRRV